MRQRSRIIKNNLYPEYDTTFTWTNLNFDDLREKSIQLVIWTHDLLASDQFVGGIRLNLGDGMNLNRKIAWMDATIAERSVWTQLIETRGKSVSAQLELRHQMDLF